MSQILADAELARQLETATGPILIVNAEGKALGVCMPANLPKLPPRTPEYIKERRRVLEPIRERIRQNPKSGKSLKEIIANLEKRAGEGA
jgi:hypothetical protein